MMRWSRQPGFTLLEVLLVVLLMGLAAAAVTLSMGGSGPKQELERSARQFISATEMVLDEVVLNGQFVGVVVDDHSYEFVLRKEDKWVPLKNDRLLAKREFDSDTSLSLVVEGLPLTQEDEQDDTLFEQPFEEAETELSQPEDKALQTPQILLFPSGEMTAFELTFFHKSHDGQDAEVLVVGNALGQMTLGRPDEQDGR